MDAPKKPRAPRGSSAIYVDGKDAVTGKDRFYGRFTGKTKRVDAAGKPVAPKRWDIRLEFYTDSKGERRPVTKEAHAVIAYEQAKEREAATGEPYEVIKPVVAAIGPTVRDLAIAFSGYPDFAKGVGLPENKEPKHGAERYRAVFWSGYKCSFEGTAIDGMVAADVEPHHFKAWINSVRVDGKGCVPRRQRLGKSVLSTLFGWAIGENKGPKFNPTRDVKTLKYDPKAKPHQPELAGEYSPEEVGALLAGAREHAPDLVVPILVAATTGARPGEIAALRWSDIDFEASTVTFRGSWQSDTRKNGEEVTVALDPVLRAELNPIPFAPGALVTPNPRTGHMRRASAHKAKDRCWGLRDLTKRMGVRDRLHPLHTFRKFAATELAKMGATELEIARVLGQKTVGVAKNHYVGAKAADKRALELGANLGGKIIPFPKVA